MSRPSEFSQTVADAICERLAEGESLRTICSDDALPARSTVFKWLATADGFADQYARAREAQAEALFEDMLEIADDSSHDVKLVGREGEEREVCDTEFVARAKLRVDTRKWMASKLAPKKYGDRIMQEHSVAVPEELLSWLDRRS